MKGTLEILVGVSGSGKSSYAHEQWMLFPDNVTIVNRDKIRELLYGFTEADVKDYYGFESLGKFEKRVTRYEDTLINDALNHGNKVIVDATHLSVKYIERFKYWNVPTTVKVFDISLGGAIGRDANRNRSVGDQVINMQYRRYESLKWELENNPIDFTPVTLENDSTKPRTVIFDIDGTLAHMKDRSPYEWLKVGQDTVDLPTCLMADFLDEVNGVSVTICTGRDGVALEETKKWLDEHDVACDRLYIRAAGDSRPDWVIKEEMWREIAKENYIVAMFDDRLQVVRRARSLGLKVFNVAYNNF